MDNNEVKAAAEQAVKSLNGLMDILTKRIEVIKQDLIDTPEKAEQFAKDIKAAEASDKIKEFKQTLKDLI